MRILLVEDDNMIGESLNRALSDSWNNEVESNAVVGYIHRLRQKISPQMIRTVRELGYQMVLE